MANPVVTIRPNESLVDLAKKKQLNLRELLEKAILKELGNAKCPTCGRRFDTATGLRKTKRQSAKTKKG